MKKMELCCRTNGMCCCTSISFRVKHTVMSRGCHWLCEIHGKEYDDKWRTRPKFKRSWEYGRLHGDPKGYVPRRGTIPDLFMRRIAILGPLYGICTGADKQPAINLKKAGYVYTTKSGYALTRKGRNYVAKEN